MIDQRLIEVVRAAQQVYPNLTSGARHCFLKLKLARRDVLR